MPNQYLYNKQVMNSPWGFVSHKEDVHIERLHQQSGLPFIEKSNTASAPKKFSILNLAQWHSGEQRSANSVLLVNGYEEVEVIQQAYIETTVIPELILIDFPVFSDGRGYSLARLLKREPWFSSDIGAIGDILQDQIFFYWRCGFDAILPRKDQKMEDCIKALQSFSATYQPAEKQPETLLSS